MSHAYGTRINGYRAKSMCRSSGEIVLDDGIAVLDVEFKLK